MLNSIRSIIDAPIITLVDELYAISERPPTQG